MADEVVKDITTGQLASNGQIFVGGYKPPNKELYDYGKKEGLIEILKVVYNEEIPVHDKRTEKVVKGKREVGKEYHVGYFIEPKTPEEIAKWDARQPKQTQPKIDPVYDYLVDNPATKENMYEQIEKLKEYCGIK